MVSLAGTIPVRVAALVVVLSVRVLLRKSTYTCAQCSVRDCACVCGAAASRSFSLVVAPVAKPVPLPLSPFVAWVADVPSARLVAAWRLHHASTGVSLAAFLDDRHRSMRAVNPSFVLRNCIAQAAIEACIRCIVHVHLQAYLVCVVCVLVGTSLCAFVCAPHAGG